MQATWQLDELRGQFAPGFTAPQANRIRRALDN
jgi:hypothetical protein